MVATMASKKTGTHYAIVERDYLLHGVSAVQKLWEEGKLSRDTIRLVKKDLATVAPDKVADLDAWVESIGRTKVERLQPGEERVYKAQATKDSPQPFIRLPLWDGAKKGDGIIVRLDPDGHRALSVRELSTTPGAPVAPAEPVAETPAT